MRDIITTGIRNNLRSRNLFAIFIGIGVMVALGISICYCLLLIDPAIARGGPNLKSFLESQLGMIMYPSCVAGVGISVNVFAIPSLAKEKSRGNIESLLATPLKAKDIWLGKSLAVFLPGLVLGEVITAIVLVAINYIYIIPKTDIGFLTTPEIAVSTFVMVPIIFFCHSLLVHLIGLSSSPSSANVVTQIVLPLLIAMALNLDAHTGLDVTSWDYTLISLGIAAAMGIAVASLYPHLTREKIVLSRRG
jgi:energy-converting hydrogenase Eha subunit A